MEDVKSFKMGSPEDLQTLSMQLFLKFLSIESSYIDFAKDADDAEIIAGGATINLKATS